MIPMSQAERPTEFVDVDLSGAVFREVNLMGSRMRGVLLMDADIDGAIDGLVVNGVEVGPLISDELDRRHPERTKLRPTDANGCREAWHVVESFWSPTMARVADLSEADRHRSVDGEWSFAETLRHLVFVTDGWLGRAVLDEHVYHPLGLPPSFVDGESLGIVTRPKPSYAEVVAAREGRLSKVRNFVSTLTDKDLDQIPAGAEDDWPPPGERTVLACLLVILDEEWAHHQFAVRDLNALAPR